MTIIRLLGAPSLEGPAGPLEGPAVHRRRLALLALLVRAPRRTLARDRLSALLWPEADSERARHNLADAVYAIRRALGAAVLRTRGDDLTLAESVTADVDELEAAERADDWARVVRSYPGPFMDGFHVSAAAELDRWLEGERTRLAGLQRRALASLAEQAERDDRWPDAAAWWRRLSFEEPYDSRIATRLVQALCRAGDRAGALAHAERHAALLSDELGLEADPEIRLAAEPARVQPPESAAVPDAAAPGPPSAAGVPTPAVAPPARSRWVVVASLAATLLVTVVASTRFRGSISNELVADRIVVLPFQNRTGDPAGDGWSGLAADLVVRALAQAEVGDVVLPFELAPGAGSSDDERRRLTRDARAGLAIAGVIDRVGDSLLVGAMVSSEGSRVSKALVSVGPVAAGVADPRGGLEALVGRIVGAVASHLGQEASEHPFPVRAPTWDAYRVSVDANRAFLDRRFAEAAALYRQAHDLDTTAVAYLLWSAVAHSNIRFGAEVQAIVARVAPKRDRLSRFDAALLDWLDAKLAGNLARALGAARAAHEVAPHSGLGGYQLGFELIRSGRPAEAARVLRGLDPDRGWLAEWSNYWLRLASAHHLAGDHRAELQAAELGYRRHRTEALSIAKIRALAALGREDAIQAALRESTDPPAAHLAAARALRRHRRPSSTSFAERGLEALGVAAVDSGSARRLLRARLLFEAGRPAEALTLLEALLDERPTNVTLLGWTGSVQARLGLVADAQAILARLRTAHPSPRRERDESFARAAIHAELGSDPRYTLGLLRRVTALGWGFDEFHYSPFFDQIRSDPELIEFFAPHG
ncbi:MAG: BTAD domain-containing putative transcriptional regulator [Gemmatimonadales bacterium]